jgi:hypothetical protein
MRVVHRVISRLYRTTDVVCIQPGEESWSDRQKTVEYLDRFLSLTTYTRTENSRPELAQLQADNQRKSIPNPSGARNISYPLISHFAVWVTAIETLTQSPLCFKPTYVQPFSKHKSRKGKKGVEKTPISFRFYMNRGCISYGLGNFTLFLRCI